MRASSPDYPVEDGRTAPFDHLLVDRCADMLDPSRGIEPDPAKKVRYDVRRHNWRDSRDRSARGRFRNTAPEVWQDVSQRAQFHRSRDVVLISRTDYSFSRADFSSTPCCSGALKTTARCVLRT